MSNSWHQRNKRLSELCRAQRLENERYNAAYKVVQEHVVSNEFALSPNGARRTRKGRGAETGDELTTDAL